MNNGQFIHYFKRASLDGLGVVESATGNYSVTPASFQVRPLAGEVLSIARLLISINDGTINNSDEYGGLGILANGVEISVKDANGKLFDITSFPIKKNGHLKAHCYDVTTFAAVANGNDWLAARWTFAASGEPIILNGDLGQYIEVLLQDDFSQLIEHNFIFQGYYTNKLY